MNLKQFEGGSRRTSNGNMLTTITIIKTPIAVLVTIYENGTSHTIVLFTHLLFPVGVTPSLTLTACK
jgi:hypothetical protein